MKSFLLTFLLVLCTVFSGATTRAVQPITIRNHSKIASTTGPQKTVITGSDGVPMMLAEDTVAVGFDLVSTLYFIRCVDTICSSTTTNIIYQTSSAGPSTGCLAFGSNEQFAMSLAPDGTARVGIQGAVGTCPETTNGQEATGLIVCLDKACGSSLFSFISANGYDEGNLAVATDKVGGTTYVLFDYADFPPNCIDTDSCKQGLDIASCTPGGGCDGGNPVIVEFSADDCMAVSSLNVTSTGEVRFSYVNNICLSAPSSDVHYVTNSGDTLISSVGKYYVDMALNSSDLGQVAFENSGGGGFEFVNCGDAPCSSQTGTTFVFSSADTSMSVVVGPDGFARIAASGVGFGAGPTGTIVTIRCKNVVCDNNAAITILSTTNSLVGRVGSLTLTNINGRLFQNVYAETAEGCPPAGCEGGYSFTNAVLVQLIESAVPEVIQFVIAPNSTYTYPPNTTAIPVVCPDTAFVADIFDSDMDPATINIGSFTVRDGFGLVGGTVSYDNPTRTAKFTFSALLRLADTYTVTATTAMKSVEGVALARNAVWRFRTYGKTCQPQQPPKFISRQIIDLIGLNPGITIPVRSKDGIIPFGFTLVENPIAFVDNTNTWNIVTQMVGVPSPALVNYAPVYPSVPSKKKLPVFTPAINDTTVVVPNAFTIGTGPTGTNSGWFFIDSSYVSHFFGGASGITPATVTTDGSGLTLSATGNGSAYCASTPCPTVTDAGGNITANSTNVDSSFVGPVASLTDPNNNKIIATAYGDLAQTVIFTDTMGLTVLTASSTGAFNLPPSDPLPTNKYSYTDASGKLQSFVVSYGNFYQSTNFGCAGIIEMPRTPVYLPVRVSLPDGSFYAITYESSTGGDVTGRIASVRVPTGGLTRYVYGGVNCQDGSVSTLNTTTPDGGTWVSTHTLN